MSQEAVRRVLAGDMRDLPPLNSRIVRIFISSTFSDTHKERNILMEKVYPDLKTYCRETHGLEFQVVDMRWGVTDEHTANHTTGALCLQEIKNCQRLSTGPSFVAFLGQRYGYRPIPTVIDKFEFESLIDELDSNEEDCSVLKYWYEEDTNAIPPEYTLYPITHRLPDYLSQDQDKQKEAQGKWKNAFKDIQRLLRQGSEICSLNGTMSEDQKNNYYMSVTESEIHVGVMGNQSNTSKGCLCFVRLFKDISDHLGQENSGPVNKYIDMDDSSQKLLTELRDVKLPEVIDNDNIARFSVAWDSKHGINPDVHDDYLKKFSTKFFKSVCRLVDQNVAAQKALADNELFVEVLQHLSMAKERCAIFQGRKDILNRIQQCVSRDSKQPIVVYGDSGSGKTSVMAKIASMVKEWIASKNDPILILRFLGTSPSSTGIYQTLASVCSQIAHNFQIEDYIPSEDFNQLVREFEDLLKKSSRDKPIVVMLDSLDQLSPRNYAYKLSWLPRSLPDHAHFIVSTLPVEHNILETLRKRTKSSNFVNVPILGDHLSFEILSFWMEEKGRTLTDDQMELVKAAFTKCSLPLFVKLVFEQALTWKSYDPMSNTSLAHTIRDIISNLFDRLERKHGHTLVTHALAYLTAAKSGLSETELEDILSLDDEVLSSVFQYHIPPIRRIPQLLWVRISHDISTYVVTREADGARVTYWYHRQFIESARERYLKDSLFAQNIHSAIADYFLGCWSGKEKPFKYTKAQMERWKFKETESKVDRKVATQPLVFARGVSSVRYNLRKLNNLNFHLFQAKRVQELKTTCLFNYEWLLTKLKATMPQAVLADFEMVQDDKEVDLLHECLNMSRGALSKYPTAIAVEIYGRLIPYVDDEKSVKYPNIRKLVGACMNEGVIDNSLVARQQCFPAPGGPLKYALEHDKIPPREKCIHVTPDGASVIVLTSENQIVVWDLVTGDVEKELSLPAPENIKYNVMELCPDQRHLCIGAAFQKENNPIVVFDTMHCDIVHNIDVEKIYQKVGFTEKFKPLFVEGGIIINNVGKDVDMFDLEGHLVHSFNIPATQMLIPQNERYVVFLVKSTKELQIFDLRNKCFVSKTETSHNPTKVLCSEDTRTLYIELEGSKQIDIISMEKSTLMEIGRKLGTIDTGNKVKNPIKSIKLSIDNKYLLIRTCEDLVLWNLQSNQYYQQFPIPNEVKPEHRVMSFDGYLTWDNQFLLAFYEGHIIMWNAKSGKVLCILHGSKWPIGYMAVTVKTPLFVTATERNNILSVWDVTKMDASLEHTPLSMAGAVRYSSIARKGSYMAVRSHARDVGVIDVNTGQLVSKPSRENDAMWPGITCDGKYTLLRDYNSDEAFRAWESRTAKLISTFPIPSLFFKMYCSSQDSKLVATHQEESPTTNFITQIWEIATGKPKVVVKAEQGGLSAMFFCVEDQYIVTLQQYPQESGGRNCKIHCYDSESGENQWTMEGIVNDSLVAIPNSSNILAVQAGSDGPTSDKSICIEVTNGSIIAKNEGLPLKGIADISNDGKIMVDNELRVMDVRSCEMIVDFKEVSPTKTAFSRVATPCLSDTGAYLVWLDGAKGVIKLGKVSTKSLIGICPTHSTPLCLQLSSSNVVAVGCDDGRVMLLQIVDTDEDDVSNILASFPKKKSSRGVRHEKEAPRAPRSTMCSLF